jgi:hypothetical protein
MDDAVALATTGECIEQVERPKRVHGDHSLIVALLGIRAVGSEMVHVRRARGLDHMIDKVRIFNRSFVGTDRAEHVRDPPEVRAWVQDRVHVGTTLDEAPDQIRADEPRSPRNEDGISRRHAAVAMTPRLRS